MITIRTIPHAAQRYPTVGDWVYNDFDDLAIRVSNMGDWRYHALVGIHELVEALLCQQRGINELAIVAFDKEFEAKRAPDDLTSEPGHDPAAPYHDEHVFAEKIERLLAEQLGVDWESYAAAVNALP